MNRSKISVKPVTFITQTNHQPAACAVCKSGVASNPPAKAGLSQQIHDFFYGIFDTKNWPPRWHCGTWSDFHGWVYIISDLLIWGSYFVIPILLIMMLKKRPDIPFPKIIWLFVAFIILCGTTHLIDAVIFWWPAYRLSALVRFATAIVSISTVYALYRVIPLIKLLRTVDDLKHEIDERKLVEKKLADSEFLLKEAGRISRMGGWEYDIKTQRDTWSSAVYDIYELPYDYEIDHHKTISLLKDTSAKQINEAIAVACTQGRGWDLELQLTTAKGNQIWIRSCGEALRDENSDEITKLRGICMDIDKYKRTEQELNRSHELLFQSHQQLKTFTHILSHNIRNHSSNIALLTDLVDVDTLDENNADLFDKMSRVSKGLNSTLDDLAEAIRIREDKIDAELVNFREVCGRVIEVLESAILNTGTIIKFDFDVTDVMFPRLYLESIIINLISNAIKYRKEAETPSVQLKTYKNWEGRTVLACTDNGLGIDLELHGNKIFGLYKTFHAHNEAHGVGLFLIKTQVESQGGNITVDSEPGKGTTFKITFN